MYISPLFDHVEKVPSWGADARYEGLKHLFMAVREISSRTLTLPDGDGLRLIEQLIDQLLREP
jgi:hypothetical protein